MSDIFSKAKAPVAVGKMNPFPLQQPHVTTANFFQFNVACARQLIPGAHGKVTHKTFARADVMDKPCLGSAQFHNRFFWVPFRTVWEPWSDFIEDVPHNQPAGTGIIANTPRIPDSVTIAFFTSTACATVYTGTGAYDFIQSATKYRFTPFGRQCYKIWRSLGYGLLVDLKSTGMKAPSALPLLCLAKVFLDFYYPNAYAHYGMYATIDGIMQRQVTYNLTSNELYTIFKAIWLSSYEADFFTSVWDNPVAPNSGNGSTNFIIPDITVPSFNASSDRRSIVAQQPNDGTPLAGYASGNSPGTVAGSTVHNFTQYIDSSLKALTQYIRRHQLAGSRALDRYLLEFGMSLDADKLKRCSYLGEDTYPFQIGDVMSNSDTSTSGGASLGAYAGKGIAYTQGKELPFDSDKEFGYFFVINTIIPDVAYVNGVDRNVYCTYKLDFLTGEFDGLGVDAVSQGEVTFSLDDTGSFNDNCLERVFGYAPRYYYFKVPYARLSGDFTINSINADLNSWSTVREFNANDYPPATAPLVHNLDLVIGNDYLQYDRIFLGYSEEDPSDPFKIVHHTYFDMQAPMVPLYDDYVFKDEMQGQIVTTNPNGVKLN